MPRVFLRLAYRGTAYHGWQTQAGPRELPTVQSAVQDALADSLGYRVHVHGCGRTDAGVHATDYTAHVDLREALASPAAFVTRLNHLLPDDIAALDIRPVLLSRISDLAQAHAQRSATWRAYRYRIATRKSPFDEGLAGRYHHYPLDVTAMQDACVAYAKTGPDGTLDFRAFCRRPDQYPHTRCRVDACTLTPAPGGLLDFDIRADRFLHNQVRLLVARLLDLGTGRITLPQLRHALDTGQPLPQQRPAAACGLYLVGVGYPESLFASPP